MSVQIETDDKLLRIDAPTGQDDWLVIEDHGLLYGLPMEWTVYDMSGW